jgi:hypothetical protein
MRRITRRLDRHAIKIEATRQCAARGEVIKCGQNEMMEIAKDICHFRAPAAGGQSSSGYLREWDLDAPAGSRIDKDKASVVTGPQLIVSIEEFDAIDGSVGSQIDIHLITHSNRFHLRASRLPQPEIRNVSVWVIGELHRPVLYAVKSI